MPSTSSHLQNSHSFYSEIDFSKENLWNFRKDSNSSQNLRKPNALDKMKLTPIHHKGSPSFDNIPLNKEFTPFNELLDFELK